MYTRIKGAFADEVTITQNSSLTTHLQFYQFHGRILSSIHIWGSGPAITAHGSLDLKQEIQIQIQNSKLEARVQPAIG
jgi:hypothetical protein